MEDHRAGERRECRRRLLARLAAVDDDGGAELVREGELRVEELPLLTERLGPVVAVETRLPDRDCPRVPEELAQLFDPRGVRCRRTMGIDPERGDDAGVRLCDRQCAATRRDARADRDHPRHADRCARSSSSPGSASHPSRCA